MAEIKHPKQDGWHHVWVFYHSSCHAAMIDDALDVGKMNVKPGGKQRYNMGRKDLENEFYRQ